MVSFVVNDDNDIDDNFFVLYSDGNQGSRLWAKLPYDMLTYLLLI